MRRREIRRERLCLVGDRVAGLGRSARRPDRGQRFQLTGVAAVAGASTAASGVGVGAVAAGFAATSNASDTAHARRVIEPRLRT